MTSLRRSSLCLGLVLAIAVVAPSFAGLLDERESTMRQVARALRAVQQMVKRHEFDAGETARRGAEIAGLLERFKDLFPAGSERADETASPAIWTDRDGFEKARVKAGDAALALGKVTAAGDLPDAVARAVRTCKACHDKFRVDP